MAKQAGPTRLISQIKDKFPIQKALHKSGWTTTHASLPQSNWLVRIKTKMVSCLLQLDRLTIFFPGQQVEQVADKGAL